MKYSIVFVWILILDILIHWNLLYNIGRNIHNFGRNIENKTINLPSPAYLHGTNVKSPYFFVGDEAFPFLENLLCPFPGKRQTLKKSIYNYRLSRARRVIENTFGILATRWQIYRRDIIADIKTVEHIIMGTVILHNFLRTLDIQEKEMPDQYCPLDLLILLKIAVFEGQWRQNVSNTDGLQSLNTCTKKNSTTFAKLVQQNLVEYFCSPAGELAWQYDYVTRGSTPVS